MADEQFIKSFEKKFGTMRGDIIKGNPINLLFTKAESK